MIAFSKEKELLDALADENPDALLPDGLESAFIGITASHHQKTVAVYDLAACAQILIDDGMTAEEAIGYLEQHTLGAWVGESGPLFVRLADG